MNTRKISSVDILVVGGGPVGLTMACELFRHGVKCRIIEKKSEPSNFSKAAGIQARTLEVLQDMGIVEHFLEKGRQVTEDRINSSAFWRIVFAETCEHSNLLCFKTSAPDEQTKDFHFKGLGSVQVPDTNLRYHP